MLKIFHAIVLATAPCNLPLLPKLAARHAQPGQARAGEKAHGGGLADDTLQEDEDGQGASAFLLHLGEAAPNERAGHQGKAAEQRIVAWTVRILSASRAGGREIGLAVETPTQANRVRAVASKLFAKAELWGHRPAGSNPAKGQDRSDEVKKDRHLSDRELLALGEALAALEHPAVAEGGPAGQLASEDPHALAAIKILLLTGMRKSELIGDKRRDIPALRWEDVDLEAGLIRLGHHKTVKKAGARMVLLCPAAVDLLENLPKVLGNPYVIPGRRIGEALQDLQGAWMRARMAVATVQEKTKVSKKSRVNLADVTIHDLRRSFASLAARMGYPELIVAALLGHAAGTVTAGYARLGVDPLREVVNDIGSRMAALLDGSVDPQAEIGNSRKARGAS